MDPIEYFLWLLVFAGIIALAGLLSGFWAVSRVSKHNYSDDWRLL